MKTHLSPEESLKQDIIAFERLEDNVGNDEEALARMEAEAEVLHEKYRSLFERSEGGPLLTDIEWMMRERIEKYFRPPSYGEWTESLEPESEDWRQSIPDEMSEEWKDSLEPEDTDETWRESLKDEE